MNWITYFANIDVAHATEWKELMTPKATGLILKSIRTDFKLVRIQSLPTAFSHLQRASN